MQACNRCLRGINVSKEDKAAHSASASMIGKTVTSPISYGVEPRCRV